MADTDIPGLTSAGTLTGSEVIHGVQSSNSRGVTVTQIATFLAKPFMGFRATKSSTQSISASTTTEVTFGTEVFDTESAFASNRFTVPVGLNGKYMNFSAGIALTASAGTFQLLIQVSTDSGSSWTSIVAASASSPSFSNLCETGPYLLTTGDIWRVAIFTGSASTIDNVPRSFFAGAIL
jgi:hypothetical protein